MSPITNDELTYIEHGVLAAWTIPLIDSIEDYVWESIFAHALHIPISDPLFNLRKKLLFDIVDTATNRGWSAKAVQHNFSPDCIFELVIQRADIVKKARQLGFPQLTLASPPQDLGAALLTHWYQKVDTDATIQGVTEKRICILVKSKNHKRYAVIEEELARYLPEDLDWQWTNATHTGLQGIRRHDGFCVFRWYPNQKQLFERFSLRNAGEFTITPKRLPLPRLLERLNKHRMRL